MTFLAPALIIILLLLLFGGDSELWANITLLQRKSLAIIIIKAFGVVVAMINISTQLGTPKGSRLVMDRGQSNWVLKSIGKKRVNSKLFLIKFHLKCLKTMAKRKKTYHIKQ